MWVDGDWCQYIQTSKGVRKISVLQKFPIGAVGKILIRSDTERGVLRKCVSTCVRAHGRTFTLTMYGVLYQCDTGYSAGVRGET